jgi:hypothetical protein
MPFELPEKYNDKKADGSPKSKNTVAMYKTHLNKLATATGYTTVTEFVKHSMKVVKAINELCVRKPDEAEATYRARKRVFYSAIFMILPAEVTAKPNAFYVANKKIQDGNPADFK